MSLYKYFQSVAFRLDPELIHEQSLSFLSRFPKLSSSLFSQRHTSDRYRVQLGELQWSFPVGLAAGLDKNAEAVDFFSRLYFGAIEVGTVTPRPQEGNPKPRLFRLIEEKSLLNRMGFNNRGAEEVYQNIQSSQLHGKVLGINIGKNKVTPQEKAIEDYTLLYKKFAGVADYLVINISSPNTPGLRDLQSAGFLRELLRELGPFRERQPCPLYLKLSPDIDEGNLPPLIKEIQSFELSGIIATNTTIVPRIGKGGVSGELLKQKAKTFRHQILDQLKETPDIQFIGVGGVSTYEDLVDFWKHGGKAMQIYTSFIYQGPDILQGLKESIDRDLSNKDLNSLEELMAFYRETFKG